MIFLTCIRVIHSSFPDMNGWKNHQLFGTMSLLLEVMLIILRYLRYIYIYYVYFQSWIFSLGTIFPLHHVLWNGNIKCLHEKKSWNFQDPGPRNRETLHIYQTQTMKLWGFNRLHHFMLRNRNFPTKFSTRNRWAKKECLWGNLVMFV